MSLQALTRMIGHLADWIMKFVLLFFIVARFVSGPPAEVTAAEPSAHSSESES